jgi:peptide/nickel transport system permease protein
MNSSGDETMSARTLSADPRVQSTGFRRVLRLTGRAARYYTMALTGGIIVVFFVFLAIFAPWVAPRDPNQISLMNALQTPNRDFLLGTDNHGRDIMSRIIFGARVSLGIALTAVATGTVIGVFLGVLAGWYMRLQTPIMRFMDVLLSFPSLIVALTIIAVLGTGIGNLIIAIAISVIPDFARLVNGSTLSVKENTYVEAARAVGASDARILSRYILPNVMAPIVVQTTLLIPAAIMTAAALSFLGLGVAPPTAEWGSMIQGSIQYARTAPHIMFIPGIALMLVVFGFNVMGDGLRDALDPHVRK